MHQPRRILHVISQLDGYGGARMLRHLAASQAAAGDRVVVAALTAEAPPVLELRDRGVPVTVLGRRWALDPIALARLVRLRGQTGAEVMHAWDPAALAAAALPGRARGGYALIATLERPRTPQRWVARAFGFVQQRVAALIVAEDLSRAWLEQLGAAAERIETIRPGVPRVAAAGGNAAEFRARLELPADAPLIAVAGPLRRHKQFDEAIWCFELVRVLHEQARLLIFGDGPDRARLEEFAESVSEAGCVRFLGYRDDLAELLPQADVYWQLEASSVTPLALLEAQAAGLPVVAGDVPAHRAAIVADRTGRLAQVGSRADVTRATDDLINHPAKARRLGAAAAANVAVHWSLDASLNEYDRLYHCVLQSR